MNIQYLRADHFCQSVRDGTHDTPTPCDKGYKLVTGKHIKNGQIDPTNAYYISAEDYEAINARSLVEQWDVLMSMIGTVGEAAVVKDVPKYAIKNVALFKTGGSELKGKWLAYYLNSSFARGNMTGNMKGSSQQFLSLKQLREMMIPFTDLNTMQEIIDILSAYDYLIENNQKQIKLLEEAAQRLYKEWFIDLHFPGHETTPIVNGIPEGWRYIELQDFAAIVMGQSPKSEYFNLSANGLPFHQGVGSYGFRFVRDQIFTTSLTKIANAGNILFSVRAPVGRLNITQNKIVIGRGLAALAQKYGYQSFLFYTLKEHFFKDNIIGNGSIFASISKDELASLQFLIPTDKLVKSFEDMASKYDAKIKSLDNQINLLTEARDRLLPKLMSGEILV